MILLVVGLFSACSKDDSQETIDAFIAENNLDAQVTDEGLYYVIDREGTGKRPTITSDVTVQYKGFLTDGTVFDGNQDSSLSDINPFNLTQVIRGWQLGIPLFKEGGEGMLIIPPTMAYGNNPPPGSGIPNNAVLIFEVKLINVE